MSLRIGLAAVRNVPSFAERLEKIDSMLQQASEQDVAIVCFPEAFLPGLRGMDFEVATPDQQRQVDALDRICELSRSTGVGAIVGMEWESPDGLLNAAAVVSRDGAFQGLQTKNHIPPEEEPYYIAGTGRSMFEVDGVPFGIAICHEGWRYPESVRWAAQREAKVVFHPQLTGSDLRGRKLQSWGDPASPYYESAMVVRSVENTVYFASVNYAMKYQESATSLVDPDGECAANVPYGEDQLLVCDLDLERATGFYARRFDPALYGCEPEERPEFGERGSL